jgi:hypothetical protein
VVELNKDMVELKSEAEDKNKAIEELYTYYEVNYINIVLPESSYRERG